MDERPRSAGNGGGFDPDLARRFQHKLSEVRPPRRPARGEHIKYDESGYPLDPRTPTLAARLRRLITG
jgi:hypothetical protein